MGGREMVMDQTPRVGKKRWDQESRGKAWLLDRSLTSTVSREKLRIWVPVKINSWQEVVVFLQILVLLSSNEKQSYQLSGQWGWV